MKKSSFSFEIPSRQSISAIVVFIYNFLVRMLKGFWPVLLVLLFRSSQKQDTYEVWLNTFILIGAGFSLLVSVISYFRYFYHVESDRLVIQQGVFNRSRINLPFERIQHIQIEQKVLHRLLQVVSIRIDSAGSQGSEITIEALEREKAEALRSYVLAQKKEKTSLEQDISTTAESDFEDIKSKVLTLSLADLIRVGISQNHLRMAGIIVGAVFGFVFTLADSLGDGVWEEGYERVQDFSLTFWFYFILAFGLITVAFVLTVLLTIARYYGLIFSESHDGFELKAGLFNRRETALKKDKIQIIRWANNPIRKLLGFYQLTIRQANAGGLQRSKLMIIPGCKLPQIKDVVGSSFPNMDQVTYMNHRMDRAYISWYFRFTGILPLLVFGALAYFLQSWQFLVPALGIPFISFFLLRAYCFNYELLTDQNYLKTIKGVWGRTYSLLPIYKIQAVEVQQSYFQRKRGLATLVLYTAGGSMVIPFIPQQKAGILRDYVLYGVESSAKAWM